MDKTLIGLAIALLFLYPTYLYFYDRPKFDNIVAKTTAVIGL